MTAHVETWFYTNSLSYICWYVVYCVKVPWLKSLQTVIVTACCSGQDYDEEYDDYREYDDEYSGSGADYDYDYESDENGSTDEYEYESKYFYIPYCHKKKEIQD